jgi:succinate-semialdehyde dehydrogenase/glutarate-semialdehyde dehydrogenase
MMSVTLRDASLLKTAGYIDGAWVAADSGETFPITNPATGEVIATVPNMGAAETRRAIVAAEKAQKAWAKKTAKERSNIIRKWAELMLANQEDLAVLMTAEQGKPLAEARGEVAYAASFFEWFAEEARRVYGEVIPGHQPDKRLIVLKRAGRRLRGDHAVELPRRDDHPQGRPRACGRLRHGGQAGRADAPVGPGAGRARRPRRRAFRPLQRHHRHRCRCAQGRQRDCATSPIVRKLSFTGSTEVGKMLMAQSAGR